MRIWVYTWKSSEGFRHEGEIEAPDKDAAFAALRAQGIRPIRVTERIVPVVRRGFRGLRKRDWLLISVGTLLLALVLASVLLLRGPESVPVLRPVVRTLPRHCLALPDDFDFTSVFDEADDAELARYAQPGRLYAAAKGTSSAADPAVLQELRGIVAGMREEARRYRALPDGAGHLAAFLEERQQMERAYREQFVRRVRAGELSASAANEVLATMGLGRLPDPSGKESGQ